MRKKQNKNRPNQKIKAKASKNLTRQPLNIYLVQQPLKRPTFSQMIQPFVDLYKALIHYWTTNPKGTAKRWLFLLWDIPFKFALWSNAYSGLGRLTYLYAVWYLKGARENKPKDPISSIMDDFVVLSIENARSTVDPFNLSGPVKMFGRTFGNVRQWFTFLLIVFMILIGGAWIWFTNKVGKWLIDVLLKTWNIYVDITVAIADHIDLVIKNM